MHYIENCEDTHMPCNAYCSGGIHADIVYTTRQWGDKPFDILLKKVQNSTTTIDDTIEVIDIIPAREAPILSQKYPQSTKLLERPSTYTEAFLVHYRRRT